MLSILQTCFHVVGRSCYVMAFHCSLLPTQGVGGGHVFEISVTRLIIEVTRLVHVLMLTVLVIVMFYFQLPSNLSLISMVCRMMCTCILHVIFIPMCNCVTMRIISLLSAKDLWTERVPDVCASANDLLRKRSVHRNKADVQYTRAHHSTNHTAVSDRLLRSWK